jgi:site-specific recombinase XerD
MAPLFQRAAESLTTSLTVHSAHYYQCTGRHFLHFLDAHHHRVRSLAQLRRDPHILDWFTLLRSRQPALAKLTYSHYVIRLRRILEELAWTQAIPLLTRLVRADDIPRPDECLPRPLTAEQDQLIQQELLRRDDRISNALLLLRHTGMRIGECLDLPLDCLRSVGQDQWAVHVPLGKLRTERLVPIDAFVCGVVHRLQLLRSQETPAAGRFLLARPRGRTRLGYDLRIALHEIAAAVGIRARIVPHQFRHSFATEMLRAGVSLPVLMKLLGHKTPKMTLRYLEVSLSDVQREFQLAQLHPRHLAPVPKTPSAIHVANLSGLLDSLQVAQHVLEMFRRTLPEGPHGRLLERLANRLTKIVSEARTIDHP